MGWYSYKQNTREYLAELNKDKKVCIRRNHANPTFTYLLQVLEYSLFHPGLFTNYFTYPFKSSKYFTLFELSINFHQRRALIREGGEGDIITLTTIQDLARVVALAVDYQGEWPVSGGMRGADISIAELIALGEKIRKCAKQLEYPRASLQMAV